MSVQFLSDEWTASATEALNGHEAFAGAIQNVDLSIQFEVSDAPDAANGSYYIQIANGSAAVEPGTLDGADVTVTNDYTTAAAILTGDINTQMAFMTGKLKVAGNMAKLMMNQDVVNQLANATAAMDVEF